MNMKILYIHGFNGSPKGHSFHLLQQHLPQGCTLLGMDYDQNDCRIALEQIRRTVRQEAVSLVVGCSLGGFLTLLTEGVERFVVNPCYLPSVELPKLKAQNGLPPASPEMVSTYKPFEYAWRQLPEADKQRIHCFVGHADELFGDKYFSDIRRDLGRPPRMLFSGHHLSESAAQTLCCLIAQKLIGQLPDGPASRKLKETILQDAHKYSIAHEALIRKSELCGCFSCQRIFPTAEISTYLNDSGGRTALCPHCDTDALLPQAGPYDLTEAFLQDMNKRWF